MKKLELFKQNELSVEQSNELKGGYFCEIYIGYCDDCDDDDDVSAGFDAGVMSEAMRLDSIMATQGRRAAMKSGGRKFVRRYDD